MVQGQGGEFWGIETNKPFVKAGENNEAKTTIKLSRGDLGDNKRSDNEVEAFQKIETVYQRWVIACSRENQSPPQSFVSKRGERTNRNRIRGGSIVHRE
mmetsp:Transcript_10787/g.22154  ORF Transcript_10787/g.22154 Transcript_10787/m.22154 type:complete len:99 (-) Transcript_10787:54-350(-)